MPREDVSGPPLGSSLDEVSPFANSGAGIHRNAPHPHRSCLYGLVGEVACAGGEGTETNPYAIAANFIASFDNPWVRAYFDIGNHVKYAPSPDWIRALGKLIVKCHVKDFKLNSDGHGGSFCNIRDGSVDWPAVRAALDEIGYNGWLSIEGGDLSPQEHGKRLDLIVAGK